MTFARITTIGGTITGHIERRGWWWLRIREHDGDLCEVAMRHVVSIETGGAIEAAYNRAVERAERAMAGPRPALGAEELEELLRREEAGDDGR